MTNVSVGHYWDALILHLSLPTEVLKTGTEWRILMEMDDSTFQGHLRLTKPQFHFFLDKLEIIRPQNVDIKKVIMLLWYLWYLSNQNSFRELSDKFDISHGAAHNAIVEMLDTTCELASTFIIWPSECEKRGNAVVFHRKCGIHNILDDLPGEPDLFSSKE
ncbi:unnamed protein product [Boreogadus saida]